MLSFSVFTVMSKPSENVKRWCDSQDAETRKEKVMIRKRKGRKKCKTKKKEEHVLKDIGKTMGKKSQVCMWSMLMSSEQSTLYVLYTLHCFYPLLWHPRHRCHLLSHLYRLLPLLIGFSQLFHLAAASHLPIYWNKAGNGQILNRYVNKQVGPCSFKGTWSDFSEWRVLFKRCVITQENLISYFW